MKERILLEQVFRMNELMGINLQNRTRVIKEAVLAGGGIIDDLLGVLVTKSSDDIAALGFRNADEVITLVRNFPTAAIDDQATIIKTILENASEVALKNVAKEIVDDFASIVGSQVKTVFDDYVVNIGKYPNITADDWAERISKDLSEKFKGSQIPDLTDEITKEATERIKAAKGVDVPTGPTKAQRDELLKIEDQLNKAKSIDDMITAFKSTDNWGKLSASQKNNFEVYLRKHQGQTISEIQNAADVEIMKLVKTATDNVAKRKEIWGKIKNLHWTAKVALVAVVSGVVGFPLLYWGGYFAGQGVKVIDLDLLKKGYEEGKKESTDNATTEDPNKTIVGCPGELGFVTAIQAVYTGADGMPAYDAAKMSFDATKCTGVYDNQNYKWENNEWKTL
jgi:hypothetical protein